MISNSCVTLFRYSPERSAYVKVGTYPAWVHRRAKLKSEGGGAMSRDAFDVRIDAAKLGEACVGDMVCFGTVNEFDVAACRRVDAVSDNRFGSAAHWRLRAEFDYS